MLYFDAYEPANNVEIWGFDPQNGTSWNVTDSFTSMNQEQPGQKMIQVVGDTIYFSMEDTDSLIRWDELWHIPRRTKQLGWR